MSNQIEPHVVIGKPGQTIILYEGQLQVQHGDDSFVVDDSRILFIFLSTQLPG